jgi:Uma2 family endonuclease
VNDPARKLATFADLVAMGDDFRGEILGGEIVEKAAPSYDHGESQGALGGFMYRRFSRGGGPPSAPGGWSIAPEVDIELGRHDLVRPDIAGWRRDRVPERLKERPVRIRPDWICEVLSPSNAKRDLVDKLRMFQRYEVPFYWIVDLEHETLMVYRLDGAKYSVALTARRDETVRAEPFDAVELPVGILFGDEEAL